MNDLEKLVAKAWELGHLLKNNEIVQRYSQLAQQLDADEEARGLLEEFLKVMTELRSKEQAGGVIEVEDKKQARELEEKVQANAILSDFLATQGYYVQIMDKVNEAIANPQGDPPKDSIIVTPDDDKPRIILP